MIFLSFRFYYIKKNNVFFCSTMKKNFDIADNL